MGIQRRCSRTTCARPATSTLTYVYGDQTAVVGPLAQQAEPHAYDLCDEHASRLSAPQGWEVVRLARDTPSGPSSDDLLALADAVREAGTPKIARQEVIAAPVGLAPAPRQDVLRDASLEDNENPVVPEMAAALAPGVQRGHLRSVPTLD